MRISLTVVLVVLVVTRSWAQTSIDLTPSDRGGHAFAIMGSGSASDGGSMKGRANQLSFGQEVAEHVRCDVSHINEGHPTNNHRDGFSMQCWRTMPASAGIRVEAGVGPYFSMNTTTRSGRTQLNDKRLGLVASAAILYPIHGADTYVRAQYNHVAMPGAPSSDAIMVGLGTDFGGKSSTLTVSGRKTEIGLWAGAAKTTRGGPATGVGTQIEARRSISDAMAYSVSAVLAEKDDGMTNRNGIAVQAWWRRPVGQKWTMSAGAGPMLARDRNLNDNRDKVLGLISFEAAREVAPRTTASIRFNRVVSSYDMDADLFMIGASCKF